MAAVVAVLPVVPQVPTPVTAPPTRAVVVAGEHGILPVVAAEGMAVLAV